MVMKRFSAPPASVYPDPSRPPNDDDSEASLSDSGGSKKVKTTQSFEALFNSESLSDIIMDVNNGQNVFHAHKMIVGLKSERLAALITSVINNNDNANGSGCIKPVLYLQEQPECSAVFSRFLYFIYSGAVWLHRDYVVPLFHLSLKYGVGALASHCENYIHQLLNKCLMYYTGGESGHVNGSLPPPTLPVTTICDLCEEGGYREDTRKVALTVLSRRFSDLIRTERWISCMWTTVRELLYSDDCTCDENLILVAATDWMKRNRVQDKVQIQEILAAIRYPRLPRRVLYHLHATASFKNFPVVQDLIDAAIRYHCFKDVPEAQDEFSGLQYRARGNRGVRTRHTVCGGETMSRSSSHQPSPDQDGENNNNDHGPSQYSHECIQTENMTDSNMNGDINCNGNFTCGFSQNTDILPPCVRSCCAETHRHHHHHHHPHQHRNSTRNNNHHNHHHHHPRHQHSTRPQAIIPEPSSLVSSFQPVTRSHSPVVAAVQPRVQPPRPPPREDRSSTPEFQLEFDVQPQTQV